MSYSLQVPYTKFNGKPNTEVVHFNLTEREIFKLSAEFNMIFTWRDELKGDPRDLDPQEVIPYFTAFEEVLLSAWGEPSADGEHFRKGGRYDFEESACFNAALMMFVKDPSLVVKFLEEIVPKDMEETLRVQQENIEKLEKANPEAARITSGGKTAAELQAEIDRLKSQMPAQNDGPKEG